MNEIEPVVTEKSHFDNQDESILLNFRKFWTNMILIEGSMSMVNGF